MPTLMIRPSTVEEAVDAAVRYGEDARFLAGGTDLVIQMRRGKLQPQVLVDLSKLNPLRNLHETDTSLLIGSLVTHKTLERRLHSVRGMECVVSASRVVGGHQIRNIATVGGNIANASPAADVVVALLALGCDVDTRSNGTSKAYPLSGLFAGPGKTRLKPGELLTQIHLKKAAGRVGSSFVKVGRRKAMEISIVCAAAYLELDADRRVHSVRIALGAVGPTPFRAHAAEGVLLGKDASEEAFASAAQLAVGEAKPRDDVRASEGHRKRLVAAVVRDALIQCRSLCHV